MRSTLLEPGQFLDGAELSRMRTRIELHEDALFFGEKWQTLNSAGYAGRAAAPDRLGSLPANEALMRAESFRQLLARAGRAAVDVEAQEPLVCRDRVERRRAISHGLLRYTG